MDILKAFSLLDTDYQINIQGTLEDPIFQANQIGRLLGISNMSENLRGFDSEEKGLFLTHTLGGTQEMVFLYLETGYCIIKLNHIFLVKIMILTN